YVESGSRSPLDIFAGSFATIREKLIQTERDLRAAEAERQQQAAYLEQIVETANEALWLGDPATNLPLYVNAAYLRIWGRSLADFVASDQTFIQTVVEEDRPRMPNFQQIAERGFIETEFRIKRPDGEIRWLRERAFAITDSSGRVYRVGGVTEDITDRHAAEEHRRELLLEREKLRVLRDVIADATHDLKAPLSSINLKIHALQRADNPDRQRQIIAELEQITKRMASLIDDVLTLARLENTGSSDRKPHDLNAIVAEVAQMMRPAADARRIQLHVELAPGSLVRPVDRADLERAISNLVDNAVHYSRSDNGQITIRVGTTDDVDWIEVEDNGIGIPDEALAHIFERFYRADNARSADPGGTGLGLAIVQKIVEQHGGHIVVTSKLNVGTTFRISIPHADPQNAARQESFPASPLT
ncbi:MAG: HAMP domain-containing histidine kinase, partial [Anaerolinea sp.]|nr:HAMP domain-containing histidine kinase [Anaerolinea sp.]